MSASIILLERDATTRAALAGKLREAGADLVVETDSLTALLAATMSTAHLRCVVFGPDADGDAASAARSLRTVAPDVGTLRVGDPVTGLASVPADADVETLRPVLEPLLAPPPPAPSEPSPTAVEDPGVPERATVATRPASAPAHALPPARRYGPAGLALLAALALFVLVYALLPGSDADPGTVASETEAAGAAPFRDALASGGEGPVMTVIPTGTFRMGCLSGTRCSRDELPVREVSITAPFALGVHEVTFAEFDRYLTATGGTLRGDERWGRETRPAIHVSWEDAQGYLDWLSAETGARYRLPTEAEWEYAARAGTETPWFPGAAPDALCRHGNGADLALGRGRHNEACTDGFGRETAPVGRFEPNAFGLHDTLGNVREWVEDCYDGPYAAEPPVEASQEEVRSTLATCRTRVLRGGAFNDAPAGLRSAARDRQSPTLRLHYIGFRVARDL